MAAGTNNDVRSASLTTEGMVNSYFVALNNVNFCEQCGNSLEGFYISLVLP